MYQNHIIYRWVTLTELCIHPSALPPVETGGYCRVTLTELNMRRVRTPRLKPGVTHRPLLRSFQSSSIISIIIHYFNHHPLFQSSPIISIITHNINHHPLFQSSSIILNHYQTSQSSFNMSYASFTPREAAYNKSLRPASK